MKHKLVAGFVSLVLTSILIAGFASGLINLNPERIEKPENRNVDSENSLVGMALVKPPKECLYTSLDIPEGDPYDPDFGNPLDTSYIGLFCYYNESTGWNLTTIVPAFQNYTDHGNYIDGYVRVWQDAVGNTYSGSAYYIDCFVRVRVDGWLMSWLNITQNKAMIPYYGVAMPPIFTTNPLSNATSLARAIQRVYFSCSKGTLPWTNTQYITMKYYDFQQLNTRKLIFVGGRTSISPGSTSWFFTVPSTGSTTIVANVFIYSLSAETSMWYYDGTLLATYTGAKNPTAIVIGSISMDAKHEMKWTNGGAYGEGSLWMLILWLE